jgi:hypothetical protein
MSTSETDQFVDGQIAVLGSPSLIQRALRSPEAAAVAKRQPDRVSWISDRLTIQRVGPMTLTVSVHHNNRNEAAVLSNAIADAYLEFLREEEQQRQLELFLFLIELNRYFEQDSGPTMDAEQLRRMQLLASWMDSTLQNLRAPTPTAFGASVMHRASP